VHQPQPPSTMQALVLKFETLAGRGAMIGLIVATTFELLVPAKGLFGGWQSTPEVSGVVAWLTFFLLSLSAGLAAASNRNGSQKLLEPVITSLTSTQRRYAAATLPTLPCRALLHGRLRGRRFVYGCEVPGKGRQVVTVHVSCPVPHPAAAPSCVTAAAWAA
jgi:hypothetical protein